MPAYDLSIFTQSLLLYAPYSYYTDSLISLQIESEVYWKALTNIRCIRIRRQDTLGCWEVRTWAKGEDGEIICGEARTRSGIEYFPRDFFHRPGQNKREKWGGRGRRRVNVRHAGSRCRGLLIHLVPPTMRCRFIPPSTVFAAWPSRDSRFTV